MGEGPRGGVGPREKLRIPEPRSWERQIQDAFTALSVKLGENDRFTLGITVQAAIYSNICSLFAGKHGLRYSGSFLDLCLINLNSFKQPL